MLSAKTESFDRGDKFADYKLIDTLEEYALVSQEQQMIECFRRSPSGWALEVYREAAVFQSIGWKGAIASIYADVDLLR